MSTFSRCPDCGGFIHASYTTFDSIVVRRCTTAGVLGVKDRGTTERKIMTLDHSDHYWVTRRNGEMLRVVPGATICCSFII